MSDPRSLSSSTSTERREPLDFDEVSCGAPGFFDPLHPGEVSTHCALIAGHRGDHRGYIPAEWRQGP